MLLNCFSKNSMALSFTMNLLISVLFARKYVVQKRLQKRLAENEEH